MTIVTSDLLASALIGQKKIFADSYDAEMAAASWLAFCLDKKPQDSGGKESVDYSWMRQVPVAGRWTGELALGDMTTDSFRVTNYLHTVGFGVDRLALERDGLGMLGPRTQQLIPELVRYFGEQIYGLINGGGSASVESPTYDAAAFFGSSRTYGDSGTIDNTLATAGTSAANFRTDLAAAKAAMMSFKDDKGRYINKAPNVILVYPNDDAAVWEGLNIGSATTEPNVAPVGSDGVTMFTARGYTVIESPYLSDTAGRYFFHVSPGRAPFVFQQEFAPQFEALTTNDQAVLYERFIYKARASAGFGYGDPRLAIYTT